MLLEDENWEEAKTYFNKVLDLEPKNAEAYLGLAMAEAKAQDWQTYREKYVQGNVEPDSNLERARKFAGEELKKRFHGLSAARDAERDKHKRRLEEHKKRILMASKWSLLSSPGHNYIVALRADGTAIIASPSFNLDEEEREIRSWKVLVSLSVVLGRTVGLRADGTVLAVGENEHGECNVKTWRDIVAVACGEDHTVGLRADGTVAATGANEEKQCDVGAWKNIVSIACGKDCTIGLRSDGKVVVAGDDELKYAEQWSHIVAVGYFCREVVGLCSDGRVLIGGDTNSKWKGFESIYCSSGNNFGALIGKRKNGTWAAWRREDYGDGIEIVELPRWKDVVSVICNISAAFGLCPDGRVLPCSYGEDSFEEPQYEGIKEWRDMIYANGFIYFDSSNLRHVIVGVQPDGTVVCSVKSENGRDSNIDMDMDNWKLFDSIEQYDREMTERIQKGPELRRERAEKDREIQRQKEEQKRQRIAAEKAAKKAELEAQLADLQNELASLKGLFSGKRRRELEAQIAEIKNQITKM